ncbi:MAG: helix-turn-helix domain-containing protein [Dehalococcoidia bacterium]
MAEQLGLDKNTVYRFLNEGRLPGLQLGKKWLIEERGLREFLRREQRLQTDRRRAEGTSEVPNVGDPLETMAIVFSDIVGASEVIERVGDDGWLEIAREHNQIVWSALPGAGHTDLKSLGDGVMIAFEDSTEATVFARNYMRAMERRNRSQPAEPLSMQVGVHAGPVRRSAGDVTGRAVFIAALLTATAEPGEILVSGPTYDLLGSPAPPVGEPREVTLRVGGRVRAYPLTWREPA